jgi:protein-S-isoprenylcysteine O-methyltransferase Ste14
MMDPLALVLFVVLQLAFIWARFAVFRVDGRKPAGVRVIEVSTISAIAGGILLMWRVTPAWPGLPVLATMAGSASGAVFAWACATVRRRQLSGAFCDDLPVELICEGPFRLVRNPFYAAYIAAHAMPLLATGSMWGLMPLTWMTALYLRAALLEERKFAHSRLAWDYGDYARRTGRFLPRLAAWKRG